MSSDSRIRIIGARREAMYYEDQYPDPSWGDESRRPDPSYDANELSTHAGVLTDPAETAAYYDRISQRSAGWFRHS
jgi:hypothetical protein